MASKKKIPTFDIFFSGIEDHKTELQTSIVLSKAVLNLEERYLASERLLTDAQNLHFVIKGYCDAVFETLKNNGKLEQYIKPSKYKLDYTCYKDKILDTHLKDMGGGCYDIKISRLRNREYVEENLYAQMELRSLVSTEIHKYEVNIKPLSRATIVFVHHYSTDSPNFDLDNLVIKKPIDILNGIFFKNDCMKVLDIYQSSEKSDEDFTQIYILTPEKFTKWLSEKNKGCHVTDL